MEVLKLWHEAVQKRDPSILDTILAEDVVFYSPVVWTAQKGKMITTLYLSAAIHVIGTKDFKYVKELVSANFICLEFTTIIDGITVNGVDLITLNNSNQIIEFKVMVRPLKGMMILKEKMFALMEQMGK
ncbi:MAG: nuclear transport factor 2 family protein [Saprospiraceae bacterium]|nr:nuclear transport factor 2 family protein [Saprospiraceae bacterium]